MTIRAATKKDCEACYELGQIDELKVADGTFIPQWYYESFVDEKAIILVAEQDGEIVGFCAGERGVGNLAFMLLLAVAPKYRRQGIGRQLVQAFEIDAKSRHLIYVVLYANMKNLSNIDFYSSLNYLRGADYVEFGKYL